MNTCRNKRNVCPPLALEDLCITTNPPPGFPGAATTVQVEIANPSSGAVLAQVTIGANSGQVVIPPFSTIGQIPWPVVLPPNVPVSATVTLIDTCGASITETIEAEPVCGPLVEIANITVSPGIVPGTVDVTVNPSTPALDPLSIEIQFQNGIPGTVLVSLPAGALSATVTTPGVVPTTPGVALVEVSNACCSTDGPSLVAVVAPPPG